MKTVFLDQDGTLIIDPDFKIRIMTKCNMLALREIKLPLTGNFEIAAHSM